MNAPICPKCGKEIFAGDAVKVQKVGPHVLCSDPTLTGHKRLHRLVVDTPTGMEFGYVDDEGKEVWL
jgi:hypothetical protein